MTGPWKVYAIRNTTNGKSYVGITSKQIESRLSEHFEAAVPGRRNSNGTLYALHAAIQKYGVAAFAVEELEADHDLATAQQRERHFIKELNSYGGGPTIRGKPRGYNQTLGGETPDYAELEYAQQLKQNQRALRPPQISDEGYTIKPLTRSGPGCALVLFAPPILAYGIPKFLLFIS